MGTYKVIPDQGNDLNLRFLRICASEDELDTLLEHITKAKTTRWMYNKLTDQEQK